MGILSELVEPKLDLLITKFTYMRGTGARLRYQTRADLQKRYRSNTKICELLKINTLIPKPGFIQDAIKYVFEELTITDILPSQIVPALRSYGIMCDAVTINVERKVTTNVITTVKFKLWCKKAGRERYVHVGLAGLVITSDKTKSSYREHQQFWNNMVRLWSKSESVRLSAIFRRKHETFTERMNIKDPISFFKYESYVNS